MISNTAVPGKHDTRNVIDSVSRPQLANSCSHATRSCSHGLYSVLSLDAAIRLVLMARPRSRGSFSEQAYEILETIHNVLSSTANPCALTVQTVFLRDAEDQVECERLLLEHFGRNMPATTYVVEPPCSGAALAVEAWGMSGDSVRVEYCGPNVVATTCDGLRWVHCSANFASLEQGLYRQASSAFCHLQKLLERAGVGFENVVRTWLYLGSITGPEEGTSRYDLLNRARGDFYQSKNFGGSVRIHNGRQSVYPASTGIGMRGKGLAVGCLAFSTTRKDAFLLPLENPRQTPAYAYGPAYAPHAPKFSRAMALVLGNYITTWISGTASIVDSETLFVGDAAKQTEQTLDNIERLIGAENFQSHGVHGAGAKLSDLARVRIYVKRLEDVTVCREVCERRLAGVPVLYLQADVCRPDLLVEIEGVAFSAFKKGER
ncbi:MAG TPA: dioxygenase [Candidatus Dormibacteraeota bacterium]|nr:dioxygenase [Candidatus Dormibacteraeota bacterium]